jgi:uncharacterized Tic20 family protein
MQLDQNPFFRKVITPWYDSLFACWSLIVMMVVVFVFALAGIILAAGDAAFGEHIWFPQFLALLSGFLVVKVFIRIRTRSKNV